MHDQAPTYNAATHPVRWDQSTPCEPGPRDAAAPLHVPASALHTALVAGLDRISHGVALLDLDGHAHYANAAARALFGRLGWHSGTGDRPPPPTAWTTALRQVCVHGRRELLRVQSPQSCVVAVLTPLSIGGEALAFTVFGRDELCGSVELQMFALQYQLTHAETVVLRQLTRGLNAGAIALEHGVARTTVLTQIAAIRSKTQCATVRALLETLARMPPIQPVQAVACGA